jgi:molybdopterin converting factor subunit 1
VKVKIKTFGISREIVGGREVQLEVAGNTVAHLRETLHRQFPQLSKLTSLLIAVNQQYAEDHLSLQENDEVALIPPVSGG